MAINPYLMLSGVGMVLVAVFAILHWRRRSGAGWFYFAIGAATWIIAIAIKIAMDLTITMPLQYAINGFGIAAVLATMGVYLGLRTGILESGFSYVIGGRLDKRKYREAVAFGIGFGSIEALFIGVSSFLNVLIFFLMPEVIAVLPAESQAALLSQLSSSTLFIFPAIIERAATLMIQVFTSVLVFYAIASRRKSFLAYSILFKALVDGIIPLLVYSLPPPASLANSFIIESIFVIIAVLAYIGTKRVKRYRWEGLKWFSR